MINANANIIPAYRNLGFTPLSLGDDLKCWIDASDLVNSVDKDVSDRIQNMLDKSGNSWDWTQSEGGKQPLWQVTDGGRIYFNGVDEFLDGAAGLSDVQSDSSGLITVVMRRASSNTNVISTFTNNGTQQGLRNAHLGASTHDIFLYSRDSTNTNQIQSTNSFNNNDIQVVQFASTGSGYKVIINGVEETLDVVSGSDDGMWIDSYTVDTIRMGSLYTTTETYYEGYALQWLYSAWSADNASNLSDFFMKKYGL